MDLGKGPVTHPAVIYNFLLCLDARVHRSGFFLLTIMVWMTTWNSYKILLWFPWWKSFVKVCLGNLPTSFQVVMNSNAKTTISIAKVTNLLQMGWILLQMGWSQLQKPVKKYWGSLYDSKITKLIPTVLNITIKLHCKDSSVFAILLRFNVMHYTPPCFFHYFLNQAYTNVGWWLTVRMYLAQWNCFTKSECVYVCLFVCLFACMHVTF